VTHQFRTAPHEYGHAILSGSLTAKPDEYVNIRYPAGELASGLDEAVKNGSVRMAGLLIYYGARPGDASLLHAAYKDDYDLVALLLAQGATLDAGENTGAVDMAARLGHLNSVKAFVESGKTPERSVSAAQKSSSDRFARWHGVRDPFSAAVVRPSRERIAPPRQRAPCPEWR
jgi:hypothetical protein